jgi:methylmalonyl-CoA mutase N-terminal domain/subunit
LVRVAVQALAAVFGGTQSLHTNSYDEAIALPTEKAARLALRTQQVIAFESDVTTTVDPFAGSYAMEAMTDEVEQIALALMAEVEARGGAAAAIEQSYQKSEIENTAYGIAGEIDAGERVVVGVNKFTIDQEDVYEPLRVNPAIEAEQVARLEKLRAGRDNEEVQRLLGVIRETAQGTGNLLYPMKEALKARATVGEVSDALRDVWGVYVPRDFF